MLKYTVASWSDYVLFDVYTSLYNFKIPNKVMAYLKT